MPRSAADLRPAAVTSYGVVRVILGLILLTPAALKGHQLATEPVAEISLFTSRWFLVCVVEFEFFFALWLSFGPYPRRTHQLALLCFSTFACVALYKALTGEVTCGCFGRVPVSPWYTLALDLAALTALLRCRPGRRAENSHLPPTGEGSGVRAPVSPRPLTGEGPGVRAPASPRPLTGEGPGVRAGSPRQLACVLGISLLVGLPAALLMASYQAATLDEAGDVFGHSEFVVLEPDKWVGKRFPLLRYIDIGDRLAEGEWIVVLYHHDCPHCDEVIPKYEKLARVSARQGDAARIVVVEMPPYAGAGRDLVSEDSLCTSARLKDAKDWFVETPVVLSLREARVTAIIEGVWEHRT